MEAIEDWQRCYKNQHPAPEVEEVSHANKKEKADAHRKAVQFFEDTISYFDNELTGKELYQSLLEAAENNYKTSERNYLYAKEFLDLLKTFLY
jgi:hypothetical protein